MENAWACYEDVSNPATPEVWKSTANIHKARDVEERALARPSQSLGLQSPEKEDGTTTSGHGLGLGIMSYSQKDQWRFTVGFLGIEGCVTQILARCSTLESQRFPIVMCYTLGIAVLRQRQMSKSQAIHDSRLIPSTTTISPHAIRTYTSSAI